MGYRAISQPAISDMSTRACGMQSKVSEVNIKLQEFDRVVLAIKSAIYWRSDYSKPTPNSTSSK